MVKKLLLFAILAPMAMQPAINASFLTKANKVLTGVNSYCFNDITELATTALGFAALACKTSIGNPLKSRAPQAYGFITNKGVYEGTYYSMPYLLALFELSKLVLTFPQKNRNTVSASLGLLKLATLLGSKIAPHKTIELVQTKTPSLYTSW